MSTVSKKVLQKTPGLRFPEFPDAWNYTVLNRLLSESKERNEDLRYGKENVLSVSGEFGIVNQIEHLGRSYAGKSVHNYHVVNTGDIVYTKSPLKENPYGIIKLNKGKPGIVSTLYAVYNVNDRNVDGRFLDHYFSLNANTNRYLRPLVKKGAKNDMKVNNAYVLHDAIYVPRLSEQLKIVEFLDTVSSWIESLRAQKEALESYKKEILEKIFNQEIRFRDNRGEYFPKWNRVSLGEMGFFYRGHSYSANNVQERGLLVLRSSNIQQQKLVVDRDLQFVDKDCNEQIVLRKHDLAICMANGSKNLVGKAGEYLGDYKGKVTVGAFCSIYRSDIGLSKYLFQTIQYKKYLHILLAGTNISNLKNSDLSNLRFNFPASAVEQNKITNFLVSVDNLIEAKQHQVTHAQEWKKALMQQLFI